MLDLIDSRDFYPLILGYHFVLEVPARPASQLRNNDVAVTEEVDVEVDMMNRLMLVSRATPAAAN